MEIEQKKMRTFFGGQMKLLFFIGGHTVTGESFSPFTSKSPFDELNPGMTVFA